MQRILKGMSLTKADLKAIQSVVDEALDRKVPIMVDEAIDRKVPTMIDEALDRKVPGIMDKAFDYKVPAMVRKVVDEIITERIDPRFDALEQRIGMGFNEVSGHFDTVFDRLDSVELETSRLSSNITSLKSRLDF